MQFPARVVPAYEKFSERTRDADAPCWKVPFAFWVGTVGGVSAGIGVCSFSVQPLKATDSKTPMATMAERWRMGSLKFILVLSINFSVAQLHSHGDL
jgi:hypothetical protein